MPRREVVVRARYSNSLAFSAYSECRRKNTLIHKCPARYAKLFVGTRLLKYDICQKVAEMTVLRVFDSHYEDVLQRRLRSLCQRPGRARYSRETGENGRAGHLSSGWPMRFATVVALLKTDRRNWKSMPRKKKLPPAICNYRGELIR